MLLAELVVRHTRRFMPTRRVAIEPSFLPTSRPGHGISLLAGVVEEHLGYLDGERLFTFERLLGEAERGLAVPSIALRHRLQHDTHGLDLSRHRLLGENGRIVFEVDVHGAPVPQLLGAVLAAAELPRSARSAAIRHLREVVAGRAGITDDVVVRRLEHGRPSQRPPLPGARWQRHRVGNGHERIGGVSRRGWAIDVLGITDDELSRREVNRRFRDLLRAAHPDHGGTEDDAARRISELSEARVILLADLAETGAASAQPAAES